MNLLQSIGRSVKWLAAVAVCWAAAEGTALAKAAEVEEKTAFSEMTAWLFPYALTVLGVSLGMMVVCRSSRRRDRAKPVAYEGAKLSDDAEQ